MPTPPPPAYYASNTPEATRDAHREAVRHLGAGAPREACDLLAGVFERRALTDYLTVLCSTRIPEEALHADDVAERATSPNEPPTLRPEHHDALDKHRAWIAGIQDVLAEQVVSRLGLARLLPPHLDKTKDLLLIGAWEDRGKIFHEPTYARTKSAGVGSSLTAMLALQEILSGLDRWTAHQILFADLTGLEPPPPPAMVLPKEDDL